MKDLLSKRIRIGDEQALELLFRKYYSRLCSYANKYVNDPEEAREIVQEVFIKIWERREDIDPEESLGPYLFRITCNNSINRLRHRKVVGKYAEIYKLVYVDNAEISPHESLIASELTQNISKALKKIPPRCRQIFNLSRVDGLKYSEIAYTLNISVKTVEAQMSKALNILRLELRDYLKSQ
jgi:RNA polymerase sigma-70 factor, ECF subfamily